MNKSTIIVHISDLHFSPGTSCKSQNHVHSIPRLVALKKFLKNVSLDKLIITGDLTNRGDYDSLQLARDYLFNDFSISPTERVGLQFDRTKLGIVPGNHDAYDRISANGTPLACYQKAILNYNYIFNEFAFESPSYCRYDWIDKGDYGIYMVYVNSCYLNDPTIKRYPDIIQLAISRIPKIARGAFSLEQSKEILALHDHGMKGELPLPNQENAYIDKEKFAKSLKILVMHHYIFETVKHPRNTFMKLRHRDIVFRNIAMADFDICLCGHQHIPNIGKHKYGKYFQKSKYRNRYFMNLFRRMIGMNSIPLNFQNSKKQYINKFLTQFIALIFIQARRDGLDSQSNEEVLNRFTIYVREILENPEQGVKRLKSFDKKGEVSITEDELAEIRRFISYNLKTSECKTLATFASRIYKSAKSLYSRPFLQCIAGSTTKHNASTNAYDRSFNVYEISRKNAGYEVKIECFTWDEKHLEFRGPIFDFEVFKDNLRPII